MKTMPMCHPKAAHYGKGKCRPCYMRDYNRANRPHIAAKKRGYYRLDPQRYIGTHRKSMYGITRAEYDLQVIGQAGRCLICLKVPTENLSVDHDHQTGRIRGLLCRSCNSGLGHLGDDPQRVRRAAEYMERAR